MNATATDFIFEHAPASWHMLVIFAAIALVSWVAWKRYGPTAPGLIGGFARCCRVAAMVALILLIAGPAWRTTSTTILPGRVLVAIDRSASMSRSDGTLSGQRIEAASALARALSERPDTQPIAVEYRGIGGTAGGIDGDTLRTTTLTASGASSAIGDDLARLVADVRPDGLIVVSDGRVTTGSGLAALPNAWRGRDMALSVLATGSESVEPELVIDEVQINSAVALGEKEPIVVRLSSRALKAGPITVTVVVDGEQPITKIVEAPTGENASMATSEVRLEAIFNREGSAKVRVIAEHGNATERLSANLDMSVNVSERKLRVLILENRPRFETRYLREAFKRDKTITVHTYLAEGRWRRWGEGADSDVGPAHLPLTPAELRDYDVIVIGDIGPDALRDSDITSIDAAVKLNAVGLVWLPGETGAIAGFAHSKLSDALPVELPDAATISRGYIAGGGHRAVRTKFADQYGLLDAGETDWSRLPALLGASPVLKSKPGAEVLVENQLQAPLVISRAHGLGRALLIAVDDTWRWRRNVGDLYLHRFHSQLLRFVASGRRLGNHAWRLFANPRRAISGETLSLYLSPKGEPEDRPESVTVRLTASGGQEQLLRMIPEAKGFALRVPAPAPGTWSLEIASGIDPRSVDSDQLVVLPPSDELRDPRIDRAALTALVAGTGGQYHTDAKKLVADLPDLSRAESVSTITGWWDTWWALAIIVTLFAFDWAIRRLNRLP